MAMSTQNINTYWMMDGRVYTKHQYLLTNGLVVFTQNINTYWTMDVRVYTKHQYLLDDG
jgi:CMP-N-acetylneuraminic acid synthetase